MAVFPEEPVHLHTPGPDRDMMFLNYSKTIFQTESMKCCTSQKTMSEFHHMALQLPTLPQLTQVTDCICI